MPDGRTVFQSLIGRLKTIEVGEFVACDVAVFQSLIGRLKTGS